MALYDIFIKDRHHPLIASLLISLNNNVVKHIRKVLGERTNQLNVLEVGPGKGYFHRACCREGDIDYYAIDRNSNILASIDGLMESRAYVGEIPNVPNLNIQFDVIYAGFVLEHLRNGGEGQYEFIEWSLDHLRPGGLIVLQVPDAEKLGMEFWNIDYTHTFPTTKRSIAHAFYDNGVYDVNIYDVSGLLTHRYFTNRFIYLLTRILVFPYHYKFWNTVAYYMLGLPSYNKGNFFFSVYALLKEENLVVVARKPNR
jgi:SAM-dependent methyltransferase